MALDHRLKTALDESRLLILGAQVLFGFQFEAAFQELYPAIARDSRYVHLAGLVLLLLSVGLLIAPSLWHQIIYRGNSTRGALRTATGFAGASLLPLTLGLGAAVFVTFELLFGRASGAMAAMALTVIALARNYAGGNPRVELLALDGAGPWAAAALAQADGAVARAAIDTGAFRFAKLRAIGDMSFLPGGARYGDLPGMLALGAPAELWLASEGAEGPDLVRAAYAAAGVGGKLTAHAGSDEEKVQAAILWLARP